jgi:hypothetical protein
MPLPARRLIALVLIAAGAFAALSNAADFRTYLELARRMRHALPLYPPHGVAAPGVPPFLGLFFALFAVVAPLAPRLATVFWYLFSVGCLLIGVRLWTGALRAVASPSGSAGRLPALLSARVLVPLAAVVVPLAASLARLHLAPVLLAVVAASARSLRKGDDRTAGGLVGLATALAVYPALLLVPLAARRRWKATGWGLVTALVLTLSPVIRYEASRVTEIVPAEMRTAAGWDAVVSGLVTNATTLAALLAVVGLAALLVVVVSRSRTVEGLAGTELAAALALACTVASSAWNATSLLLAPALYVAWSRASLRGCRRSRIVFWTSAVLATAVPLIAWAAGWTSPSWMLASRVVPSLLLFALLLGILVEEARVGRANPAEAGSHDS